MWLVAESRPSPFALCSETLVILFVYSYRRGPTLSAHCPRQLHGLGPEHILGTLDMYVHTKSTKRSVPLHETHP